MPDQDTLTEQQRRWFATLREGLERDTGRSLAEWAEVARACPVGGAKARLAWMKTEHGLALNRASVVLRAAFPPGVAPDLWSDPWAASIFAAVRVLAERLDGVVVGQRKGFTAFSRRVQFAAALPRRVATALPRRGGVLLGLALEPACDPRLEPAARTGWGRSACAAWCGWRRWTRWMAASSDCCMRPGSGPEPEAGEGCRGRTFSCARLRG